MSEKEAKQAKIHRPVRFGNYLLLDRLNVGGMAEVFRAKRSSLEGVERLFAIKRILPHLARDEGFTNMFIDEARITVTLLHANIAQVYELGRVGESLYIAMEYIHGRDLRAIINRSRRLGQKLPVPLVALIVSKICEGLDYAHSRRDIGMRDLHIVHRDVSPQNVIISYEGEVKIIDFGIAKAASKRTHTEAGILKGKFGYMAPEQVMGDPIDRRADIFCVGILMYEMLTCERLFSGSNELDTLQKIRNVEVTPPTLYNPAIPPALEEIIYHALAQDPADRYQNASDLQEALQRFLLTEEHELFTPKKLRDFMGVMFKKEFEEDQQRLDLLMRAEPAPLPSSPKSSLSPESPDAPISHGSLEQYPHNTPLPAEPSSWPPSTAASTTPSTPAPPAASGYAPHLDDDPPHTPLSSPSQGGAWPSSLPHLEEPQDDEPTSVAWTPPSRFEALSSLSQAPSDERLQAVSSTAPSLPLSLSLPPPPSSNPFATGLAFDEPRPSLPSPSPKKTTVLARSTPTNAKNPFFRAFLWALLLLSSLVMFFFLVFVPATPTPTNLPLPSRPLPSRPLPPLALSEPASSLLDAGTSSPPEEPSRTPSPPPIQPPLPPDFVRLILRVTPPDAKILLDGKSYTSPLTIPLKLRKKPYRLLIRKPGHETFDRLLQVKKAAGDFPLDVVLPSRRK